MITFHLVKFLAACTNNAETSASWPCDTTSAAVDPEDASALGFSAADVADALDAGHPTWTVHWAGEVGSPDSDVFTVTVGSVTSAELVTTVDAVGAEPGSCADVVTSGGPGTALQVELDVTLANDDDSWTAAGPLVLQADGAPDAWIGGPQFDLSPTLSAERLTLLSSVMPAGTSAADLRFWGRAWEIALSVDDGVDARRLYWCETHNTGTLGCWDL